MALAATVSTKAPPREVPYDLACVASGMSVHLSRQSEGRGLGKGPERRDESDGTREHGEWGELV
jgi:hypothetical protein